jgi:hypothetical protein
MRAITETVSVRRKLTSTFRLRRSDGKDTPPAVRIAQAPTRITCVANRVPDFVASAGTAPYSGNMEEPAARSWAQRTDKRSFLW